MDELAVRVKKDHEKHKSKRVNWESHWEEILDLNMPRKNQVTNFRTNLDGDKRHQSVYDGTAIQSVKLLASALQGMLTNPSTQWFDLTTGDVELDENKAIKKWLQDAARRIIMVLNNSNFQTEIHEVYIDLASLGTAALRIEENKDFVVQFQARPIYEHWIRENFNGLVDGISREYKLEARQISQKWDLDKAKKRLDEFDIVKLEDALDKDPFCEFDILHYVVPREELPKELLPKNIRRFPWVSVHVIEKLDIAIGVGGFEEFPYAVPRWTKTSSEVYGRGPGMESLADVKMCNKMMKAVIRYAQKSTDPAYQLPDDGFSLPFKTIPGGINYYRAGTDDRAYPLEVGGNPGITKDMLLDVRRAIREAYFVDQLQLNEGPQMTATEVMQRTEEKLRLLGPVLGRLHFELLKPLIGRVIGIMGRRNLLPENPPQELVDRNIDVQFSSMIARAQRASEADNIQRIMGIMAPIVQVQPQIMDNIDGDGMLRYVSNIFNAPHEMFRSKMEVERTREQNRQMQEEQRQAELQKVQSESARNIGVQAQNLGA